MKRIFPIIKKIYPLLFITLIWSALVATNFISGTYLTGGDNLHPEFNLFLNIKRSIFASWQEYQGVGLLGGMGHASDLLRQLFLLVLSIFFPDNSLRFIWTILTLLAGSVGAYFLALKLIKRLTLDKEKAKILALSSGVFYLLNLATLQSYYTPFEVFTAHFAFLPLLFIVTINYLKASSFKNLFFLFLVLFLATPASYVPTLFVVYLMASVIIFLTLFKRSLIRNQIFTLFKYLVVVFIANAFWLLSFIYSTISNSSGIVNAKINQLISSTIYLKNMEYGDVLNVALMKGFWFSNVEPDLSGNYIYMLEPWRNYLSNPIFTIIGLIIFLIAVLGVVKIFKAKERTSLSFALLFIFAFAMLATATPPFSYLNTLFRNYVPLVGEVFRFPFTKFSILYALAFSILIPFGLKYVIDLLKRTSIKSYFLAFITFFVLVLSLSLPSFSGNFFYYREQVNIPGYYFELFDYLEKQDSSLRIANFPQYHSWEWNFYKWGYSGSGFSWYGIKQPILDRATDIWSSKNENYYWEISNAVYSENPKLFEEILNKYQIGFLWIDKSIQPSSSTQKLFLNELTQLISNVDSVKKEKDFGLVSLYKVDLKNKTDDFVFAKQGLSDINSYEWSEFDQAYLDLGDYYSSSSDYVYPFRSSLFTRKTQNELYFELREGANFLDFYSNLPEKKEEMKLKIPSLIKDSGNIPAEFFATINQGTIVVSMEIKSPSIYIENGTSRQKIWENSLRQELFRTRESLPLTIDINGASKITIKDLSSGQQRSLGVGSLSFAQKNYITISNNEKSFIEGKDIDPSYIKNLYFQNEAEVTLKGIEKGSKLVVRVPKILDNYYGKFISPSTVKLNVRNCDNFSKGTYSGNLVTENRKDWIRLDSKNANSCFSIDFPTLDSYHGYLILIEGRNQKGRGSFVWALNNDSDYSPIETYLPKEQKDKSIFVIPPMSETGNTYSLHFENISVANQEVQNDIGEIEVLPIPYLFLNSIRFENNNKTKQGKTPKINVEHSNPSLYEVHFLEEGKDFSLILSQGFNSAWKAYYFENNPNLLNKALPFLFGKRVENHVLVNNWENGWNIDNTKKNSSLIIVFLPQYLQYLGFILLIGFTVYLVNLERKK